MTLPDFLTRDGLGAIRIAGHRIDLAHLLYYYNEGYSAEMLWGEYPRLPLALIHKVIAFYLENQVDVDAYLAHCRDEIEQQRASTPPAPSIAELRGRLDSSHKARGA